MADFFLSSVDGGDGDSGATWALAKATLAGAFSAMSAGDTVFVDDSHAETQASGMTLTSPGTSASPCRVICVVRGADVDPPVSVAESATISNTGSNNMEFLGSVFYYGITFNNAAGGFANLDIGSGDNDHWFKFEKCELNLNNSSSLSDFIFGAAASSVNIQIELVDTDLRFGEVDQRVRLFNCSFIWKKGTILGTVPGTIFGTAPDTTTAQVDFRGVDLSPETGNLFTVGNNSSTLIATLSNCKLGSGVVFSTGTPAGRRGFTIEVVNCDSADTNYRYHSENFLGDVDQETTIVRSGGGSHPDSVGGTVSLTRKLVTNANSTPNSPLRIELPAVFNETTGSSIEITAEVITDNVTLTDTEAWLECEHLGTSGFPLSLFADDRASDDVFHLGMPTDQASSTESWTTTGLTTPVKQKFVVTLTAQEKGWIYPTIVLAKPSTTMYVDFAIQIDGVIGARQIQVAPGVAIGEPVASAPFFIRGSNTLLTR